MPAIPLQPFQLTISSPVPLAPAQMDHLLQIVTPDGDAGVISLTAFVFAGAPLVTYTLGALRDFFFRPDASYLLDVPNSSAAERTIFSTFLTCVDPLAHPSPELQTAVVSRILNRVTRGYIRPFPTNPDASADNWSGGDTFECAVVNWAIQPAPGQVQAQMGLLAPHPAGAQADPIVIQNSQNQVSFSN